MDARDMAAQIEEMPFEAEVGPGECPTVTWDDCGDERRVEMVRVICPLCNGNGKHVNPSIDSNGITGEEMREMDEDFREDYMSGVFDVICARCKGERWVLKVNREHSDEASVAAWDRNLKEEYDFVAMCEAEREAERRAGC